MAEPRRVPPPRSEADPLSRRDMRLAALAALAGNGGAEALPAFANRRRIATARIEADG